MKIIGHRGAKGLAPENTLASFQKALQHGVDELEFDLRVTKDGVVIVHHDRFLRDPDGRQHRVADCSYELLKAHKSDLLTFEALLTEIGHPVPLYCEVKPDEPTKPIVKIIKNRLDNGWQPEHFLLASFNQAILLELEAALPQIQKVVIEKWSGVHATIRARQLGTKRLSMNEHWLWWGFIRAMKRRGYQLAAYTVNDRHQAQRWAKYGLYGVITDYPDRFKH